MHIDSYIHMYLHAWKHMCTRSSDRTKPTELHCQCKGRYLGVWANDNRQALHVLNPCYQSIDAKLSATVLQRKNSQLSRHNQMPLLASSQSDYLVPFISRHLGPTKHRQHQKSHHLRALISTAWVSLPRHFNRQMRLLIGLFALEYG